MYRISSRAEGVTVEGGKPTTTKIACTFHQFTWPVCGVVVPDDWFADTGYLRSLLSHPGILVEQSEDGETWSELDPRAVPGSPPAGNRPGSNYYERYTRRAATTQPRVNIGAATETEVKPSDAVEKVSERVVESEHSGGGKKRKKKGGRSTVENRPEING